MEDIRNLFPLRPQIGQNPEPQALVPHVYSFTSVYNSSQRLYSYRIDEALRSLPSNALAMRRDAFISALHQERTYPTANRAWSIKVPDQRDPYQSYVARCITEAIRAIPRFDRMRLYLMEAIWYGRYGAHVAWGKRRLSGKELWTVASHRPVNGDKIFHEFDGTPGVAINPTMAASYPFGLTKSSDRGITLLMLKRPEHRRQFIIHQHLVNDADYFEPEMGGSVHGTGLRNLVYWAWWLRDEMLSWATDFMQKVGTLGLLVFFYEDGNAKAKAAAETAAAQASTEVALTMPMPNGPTVKATNNVMHIPANTGGVEALQKMIADYFERHIERLYVGQPSSGGVEGNGFGGSAGAALHADTKYQLLKWDAKNLDETLTIDLVGQLIALNHPDVDFPVSFVSAVANPEDAAKLQGVQTAAGMRVTFKMDEVRDLTGLSKPEEFDEVVGGAVAAGGMGGDEGGEGGGGEGKTTPGQGLTSNDSVERENGSGTKWADIAAYADDGSFFECYVEDESGGHWVTIGARQGDDGKRHGGVPVLIKGGRIVKGPKGMVGKTPKEVGKGGTSKKAEHEQRFGKEAVADEPAYPPEWDEPLNAETASVRKPKLRVTAAMKNSLPPGAKLEHVAELAADIRDNHAAASEYANAAIDRARQISVANGWGDLRTLAARAAGGRIDADSLKRFDEVADSVAEEFPGLLSDERGHASDKLFEMLIEGKAPKMTDKDAWDLAVRYVQENGLDRKDEPEPTREPGIDDDGENAHDVISQKLGWTPEDYEQAKALSDSGLKMIAKTAGLSPADLKRAISEGPPPAKKMPAGADLADLVYGASLDLPDWRGRQHNPNDPESGGVHKVLTADLYDHLKGRLGGASLDAFKAALSDAVSGGHLVMGRNDMPQYAKDEGRVRQSEIKNAAGGTFHFVTAPTTRKGKGEPGGLSARLSEHIASLKGDQAEYTSGNKLVDEVAGMSKEAIFQLLSSVGIDGIRSSDSKPHMLKRLRGRLTAAVRARDRNEV